MSEEERHQLIALFEAESASVKDLLSYLGDLFQAQPPGGLRNVLQSQHEDSYTRWVSLSNMVAWAKDES